MTPSEFTALVPAFKDEPVDRIQRALDAAVVCPWYPDAELWGTGFDHGLALLVAYFVTLENDSADKGTGTAASQHGAIQKSVGRVSIARAQGMLMRVEDDELMANDYGKRYRSRLRTIGMFGAAHVV